MLLVPLTLCALVPQDAFVHWETPHVTPLALTPDGTRLLAVNTPDQRLEVLALGSGRPTLLAAIPVGLDPVSVRARTDDEVWVVNHVSDSISIVSLAGARVVATLATDDEPADIVFAGTPERAFVTCSQANTVLVFDPADRHAPPVRIPLRGEDPRALAASPDGLHVYAAIFESGNRTTVIQAPLDDPSGPSGGINRGPLLTQTLQDIIGHEPFHWRGDRAGLEDFAGAFVSLLGDDAPLAGEAMQEFEDFLATIAFPPNPFRTLTNALPTHLELPGHYTTGRFAPAGQPLPAGNAARGAFLFSPPNLLDFGISACITCHTAPTGGGSTQHWNGAHFEPIAPGPRGERRVALVSVDGFENRTIKIPQLRNLHERTGLDLTQLESTAGFGYRLDGLRSSIAAFVANFLVASDQEVADLVALMLAFSGDTVAVGPLDRPLQPPGPPSRASHAAVGRQLTLAGAATPSEGALLGVLVAEAELEHVALVARGTKLGLARGWYYLGAGRWASDRALEEATSAELLALAATGAELTLTAVPTGTERRSGVDRDADGWFDRDELAAGSDPADPRSRPRHGHVPGGRRP